MDALEILISIATAVGISSIITAIMTKRKEIQFKITEQKHIRYKSMLVYMTAYFNQENLKYINGYTDFSSKEEILEYLKEEYHAMLLYSSIEVLQSVKVFLTSPIKDNFYTVCLSMRNDLWIKEKDLSEFDVRLD